MVLPVFSSPVLALTLRMTAWQLRRLLPVPEGVAQALIAVLKLALLGGSLALFGETVRTQVGELSKQLARAWQALRTRIWQWGIAPQMREWIDGNAAAGNGAAHLGSATTSLVGLVGNGLLVLDAAVYFAAEPRLYRRGFIELVPTAHQVRLRNPNQRRPPFRFNSATDSDATPPPLGGRLQGSLKKAFVSCSSAKWSLTDNRLRKQTWPRTGLRTCRPIFP